MYIVCIAKNFKLYSLKGEGEERGVRLSECNFIAIFGSGLLPIWPN
jgi:hypothetical protein